MSRGIFLIAAVLGVSIVMPATTLAAHTTFKQQILPLDCVFETINDGSGTIHYLTPAECGIVLEPTIVPTTTDTAATTGTTSQQPLLISRTSLTTSRAVQPPVYRPTYSFGLHGEIIAKSSKADMKVVGPNNTKVGSFVALTSVVILVLASLLLL